MADYPVADITTLLPGAKQVVTVRGVEIGIFNIDGTLYALPNRCTHQWGPLCEGALSSTIAVDASNDWRPQWVREGRIIVCPWHQLEFDVTTGECLAQPRIKLRRYPVRVEGDQIIITI
jgi:nitrite reductase/ring-hydroxylating ferredoxin subunit